MSKLMLGTLVIFMLLIGHASALSGGSIVELTNNWRQAHGLASLTTSQPLTSAATAKAQDMCSRDYWSHNDPNGRSWTYFIYQSGYRGVHYGENLAWGFTTTAQIIDSWANSPEHYANMHGDFEETGAATIVCPQYQSEVYQTITVQEFGLQHAYKPPAVTEPEPPEATPSPPAIIAKPMPAVVHPAKKPVHHHITHTFIWYLVNGQLKRERRHIS